MSAAAKPLPPSRRNKQKRSEKTYDTLIETAFKLLETREFDDVSIAELTLEAGYSVGAFYARFKSKDELLQALVMRHVEERTAVRERQFSTESDETLLSEIVGGLVDYFWARRRFWRAALFRSISDPDFWQPLRELGRELGDALIARMSARAKRALTEREQDNVRFAVQLTLGTINNAIINRPGPIFIGQPQFVENLARALRRVSDYDHLVAARPVRRRVRRRAES
jgi:AcrR family transcriptional regulator